MVSRKFKPAIASRNFAKPQPAEKNSGLAEFKLSRKIRLSRQRKIRLKCGLTVNAAEFFLLWFLYDPT